MEYIANGIPSLVNVLCCARFRDVSGKNFATWLKMLQLPCAGFGRNFKLKCTCQSHSSFKMPVLFLAFSNTLCSTTDSN